MTEETHQQPEKNSDDKKTIMPLENQSSTDVSKPKVDNKKEKCKPMTKVIIRRLPPTMTESQLIEQISPLPDHDYLYFVRADRSLGHNAYSRAYINFLDQQDIFVFREKFDNYVFVDSKGIEYPAVVEFAPFQRLPKKRVNKKKDQKCATITTDPYYMTFLESLKNQDADNSTTQPKTEYSYQPFDNAQKRVTTTPLLEFLKMRKAEKQRMRDEKREERRRRDIERRRTKEEPAISKVLKNPDTEREHKDNNNIREEKLPSSSSREPKNRKKDEIKLRDKASNSRDTGKSYRDREERKQERENKFGKKHEDKKSYNNKREEKDERKESRNRDETTTNRVFEEKRGKSYEKTRQEKRLRIAESKKQEFSVDETSIASVEKKKTDENNVKSRENPPKNSKNHGNTEHTVTDDSVIKLRHSIEFPDNIDDEQFLNTKKLPKNIKRRSSLGSGGEGGGGDSACLRRHKSLDGGDESNLQKSENDDKDKDKKDPRLERRIRNKDRPAMEIYRPGMGKFSKQRLERGKSIQDDRASLSQSPTPGAKPSSMIFKRSISRDTP